MKKHAPVYISLMCLLLTACGNNAANDDKASVQKDSVSGVYPTWAIGPFTKADSANPVLTPGNASFKCPLRGQDVVWDNKDVFNPAVVVKDGRVILLFRAQDSVGKPTGTSRIGLAGSNDGLHFLKEQHPVLYPDNDAFKKYEWEGGCEDPRVVEDSSGNYYMTYTAYDGAVARLLVATSTDLQHWKKGGPVFDGKYINLWSKSGAIVSTYQPDGKIVAAKINGKYWMYWGDKYIWAATSSDLIHWQPVEKEAGDTAKNEITTYANGDISHLKPVIKTRPGKYDSDLVESGPPAMLTADGIVLLYNGRNVQAIGDKALEEGAYASGQVLLDKTNPLHIVDRMNGYFMKPDKPYEITGQVNQVCFIEGLARFSNHWWLYYGTADSKIAVTVK